MKGLLEIIFERESSDPHFICCYSLKLLLNLIDRSLVIQADYFLSYFVRLPPDLIFKKYDLKSHLEVKGLRKCKSYAYSLLQIYRKSNLDKQTHLTSIFSSNKEMNNYITWEKNQLNSSMISEHYKFEVKNGQNGQRKESENSLGLEEPLERSRSHLVYNFDFAITKPKTTNSRTQRSLSLENLSRFYGAMNMVNLDNLNADNKVIQTITSKFAENKKIERTGNILSVLDRKKGFAFYKIDYEKEPEKMKFKEFGMSGLAKTAIEINKKSRQHRDQRLFFFDFYYREGKKMKVEMDYMEFLNLPSRFIYTFSSNYDIVTSQVMNNSDDKAQEVCIFLGRVEVEMIQERIIRTVSLYIQAGNEESAEVIMDQDLMTLSVKNILTLFQTKPEDINSEKSAPEIKQPKELSTKRATI